MSTLLLRFAAPLQSWGSDSKFITRRTEREPTKSGVIGFLAAALGIDRRDDAAIQKLSKDLKFGVRIDQQGQYFKDFHTAASQDSEKLKFVTERYYLADAVFLVGLEGDKELLKTLESAIRSPAFPLYLGRRSCPPAGRVTLGIYEKNLQEALASEKWHASLWHRKKARSAVTLPIVCDSEGPSAIRRRDLPLSFSQAHRKHAFRGVDYRADAILVENPDSRARTMPTEHDPFPAQEEKADVSV
jgi:CRISPR system Cascade subunit CasD